MANPFALCRKLPPDTRKSSADLPHFQSRDFSLCVLPDQVGIRVRMCCHAR